MKTAEIITRLGELPEAPKGNLSLKILEKILFLENDLRCHIDGGSEEYPFQKELYAVAVQFRNTIAFSYPRLSLADLIAVPKSSSQLAYRLSATPTPSANRSFDVIPLDSDEDNEAMQKLTQTPSPVKRKQASLNTAQSTPSKRSRLDNIPRHVPGQDSASNSFNISGTSIDRTAPYATRFTLPGIRSILQDAQIGLPNQIDPKATKRMIKDSLAHWDKPLEVLLDFTRDACRSMILQRASLVFGLWHGTRCFDLVMEICQSFFDEHFEEQVSSAKRALRIERQAALTLHEDAMRTASEAALTTLEHACRNERAKALLKMQDPEWDFKLSDRAKMERLSKVTDAQLGPNPYLQELRAIAVSLPSQPFCTGTLS